MAATVTIDKAYFETLLRRAEFHVSGKDLTTPVNLPVVSIPKVDHDNLLRMAQEYTNLRDALYRGGIAPDTLETLIRGDSVIQSPADTFSHDQEEVNGGVNLFSRPSKTPVTMSRPPGNGLDSSSGPNWPSKNQSGGFGFHKDRGGSFVRQYSSVQDDSSFPSDLEKEEQSSPTAKTEKQHYAKAEQRTIVAKNLSDRVTHKDIVDIIRGGAVLDIFLRANERSASISFIEGAAAQEFLNYAKRNDIYIHGKRIEFSWNDRQFILPGHVANKIGIGATRNLIIRGVHPNITEDRLREDLDHIHNLIVINISFQHGDAHLSLNSIHNSLFARTCMMSRAAYKGMRIEWYPDECAQPLPRMQYVPKKENAAQPAKKVNPMVNRFQMLNMDGTENGDEDSSDEESTDGPSALGSFSPMNHRSPWNSRVVAV